MTVGSIHKLDLVDIAGTIIGQISNENWDSGIETILQRGGGHVHPMAKFISRQKPVISFSTPQIDDVCVTAVAGHGS